MKFSFLLIIFLSIVQPIRLLAKESTSWSILPDTFFVMAKNLQVARGEYISQKTKYHTTSTFYMSYGIGISSRAGAVITLPIELDRSCKKISCLSNTLFSMQYRLHSTSSFGILEEMVLRAQLPLNFMEKQNRHSRPLPSQTALSILSNHQSSRLERIFEVSCINPQTKGRFLNINYTLLPRLFPIDLPDKGIPTLLFGMIGIEPAILLHNGSYIVPAVLGVRLSQERSSITVKYSAKALPGKGSLSDFQSGISFAISWRF